MLSPPPETALLTQLDEILVSRWDFQTYVEFQITSKYLDLESMVGQANVRIDLAAIHPVDASIHFYEVESQFHIQHPQLYRPFCDYCYVVCPSEQFDYLPTETRDQQLQWARDAGVGVVTISKEGALHIRNRAQQQHMTVEIRQEVLRLMETRKSLQFPVQPLWERSRQET